MCGVDMLLNIQSAKDHCYFILSLLSFYGNLTKNISYNYVVLFNKKSGRKAG